MRQHVWKMAALVTVLFGFALPITSAGAATHPTYPLGSARSCKAHYVKKILKHQVKGKTVDYIGCVYVAPKAPPKAPPPPPTTTTPPPPPTSFCVGTSSSCLATFPTVDDGSATNLQVQNVYLGVVCPDPGVCGQPAGDQLDEIVVAVGTGSSGMSDPGSEMDNFALVLAGSSQAPIDSITCDSSVVYAMCGLGPEGPNTTFEATIYFDAPQGTNWLQVNFSYTSATNFSQTVYTFHP